MILANLWVFHIWWISAHLLYYVEYPYVQIVNHPKSHWGISYFNRLIYSKRLLNLVRLCPDRLIRLFQFDYWIGIDKLGDQKSEMPRFQIVLWQQPPLKIFFEFFLVFLEKSWGIWSKLDKIRNTFLWKKYLQRKLFS